METIDHFVATQFNDIELNVSFDKIKKVVNLLSLLLINTYILSLKTFNYHWHIRTKLFDRLHAIADEQYDDFMAAIRDISNRIHALGYEIPDTYAQVAKLSEINMDNKDIYFVANELIERNENIVRQIRYGMGHVADACDNVTYLLLMQRLRKHENNALNFRKILE